MQCGWTDDETEVQHLCDKIVNWHIHIYLHAPLVILCRSHCTYHIVQIIKLAGKIKWHGGDAHPIWVHTHGEIFFIFANTLPKMCYIIMLPILLELGQSTTSVLAGFAHIILHAADSDGLSPQSPVTVCKPPTGQSHSLPSLHKPVIACRAHYRPFTVCQAPKNQSQSAKPLQGSHGLLSLIFLKVLNCIQFRILFL